MAGPNEIKIRRSHDRLVAKIGATSDAMIHGLEAVNQKITLLTKERVVERVTNEVPHEIKMSSRPKSFPPPRGDRKVGVYDLVNTGFYRAAWTEGFPTPLIGEVTNNADYARILEEGTDDGKIPPFGVATRTLKDMRPKMKEELQKLHKRVFGE